jgi:hypothetical protein
MTKGQSTMDNPEKLETLGTQDKETQNKNTRASYKQLKVKMNRISFYVDIETDSTTRP